MRGAVLRTRMLILRQNKQLDTVKAKGSPASASTSRATSVVSNSSTPAKGKAKGKKK